jgi:hypothetical protein
MAVDRAVDETHECDPDVQAEIVLKSLRREIDAFEHQMQQFLAGPEGRVESWLAFRQVRGAL